MNTNKYSEGRFEGFLDHKEVRETLSQGAPDNRNRACGQTSSPFEPDTSKNLFRAYLREIGKIPLLSKEEERALAKEIQEGQRELVRRLLKIGLKTDELDFLVRKDRNFSDESLATLMGTLERMEKLNRISQGKRICLSEVRRHYRRLTRLKGEMLSRNLRLVVSIAKGFKHSGISLSDLIQEGNLGLMKAVSKFDYRRGYKFGTYASWWIRQAIQRAVVEKGRTIRVPVHLIEERQKLTKAYGRLLEEKGKAPELQEVAQKANIPLKVAHKALYLLPETISLETPVGENANLGYFIEDEKSPSAFEVMERREMRQMVARVLSGLPPREAEILRLRFGIGGYGEHTLQEIGRKFGISRERVRQLEKKSISRLRHPNRKLSTHVEGVR
jgi:RNA polymerase primary sigma factor